MGDQSPVDRLLSNVYKFVGALVGIRIALSLLQPMMPTLVVLTIGGLALRTVLRRR